MNVREKLNLLGLALPKKPEGGGSYAHTKALGENLLYVAGCVDLSWTECSAVRAR